MKDNRGRNYLFKNKTFLDSFRYAFHGVCTVFREEKNMRFHVFSMIIILIVSAWMSLDLYEWLWILLANFLVIVMEVWNTVIENTIDLISPEYHPLAKKVKDMAAAAVLFTSLFSSLVGTLILLPKILRIIF